MKKRLLAVVAAAILLVGPHGRNRAISPTTEQYIFVQNLGRVVAVHRGQWMVHGELNSDGELVAAGKHRAGAPVSNAGWLKHIINELTYDQPKPCYELHSGRLIRGVMTAAGSFVPDVGSRVTKFEDYCYAPNALPIWNLPGYFMRRDKLEVRRKWLADHMAEDPDYAKEKAKLDAAVGSKK